MVVKFIALIEVLLELAPLKTLIEIKKLLPNLKIKNLKSGTKVYDWKIPPEWNVKEAFVKDKFGKKIIDFKNHNLHLPGVFQTR